MLSLDSILKGRTRQTPVLRGAISAMTVEKANQILVGLFGEQIIDIARAVYVKNNILTIACLSSSATQEIKLYEAKIIDEINKKIGSGGIEKIRFLA